MDKIILASASPRRKELLEGLGIDFEVIPSNIDEAFPLELLPAKVPEFLAELKAESLKTLYPDRTIISADTIVLIGNEILNKPAKKSEATEMLQKLSGKMHLVITGVCIFKNGGKHLFSETTEVYFKHLDNKEIEYYVEKFKPYDKAGAYGVQEWIGYIAVEKIIGSFYNVMGLPVNKVYEILNKF
ncbi:MAG: septum formation protein Maf [Opitutaceae bacterium]|nr:septum formation protein Maf [Cytophagales bacterium]